MKAGEAGSESLSMLNGKGLMSDTSQMSNESTSKNSSRRTLLLAVIGVGVLLLVALAVAAVVVISTLGANQAKAEVDASVKSDVRNTVESVMRWEAQDPANRSVVIDNAAAFADADISNRVFKTQPGTIIGVYAPGDGSYTVCGYNPAGLKFTSSKSAWGYDSSNGVFAPVVKTQAAEACVGAVDSRGNDAS